MFKRPRLPTRREPQQPRAQETRQHILTATAQAFEEGNTDVSMTRIAERAGYSIGTVYQYFPDRRALLCDLLNEVCETELQMVLALAPKLTELSLTEVTVQILSVLVESAAKHGHLLRTLIREVIPTLSDDEIEDLTPVVAALFAEELKRRVGEITIVDPDLTARFIIVAVESLVHDALLDDPERVKHPDFLRELVILVCGYLQQDRSVIQI